MIENFSERETTMRSLVQSDRDEEIRGAEIRGAEDLWVEKENEIGNDGIEEQRERDR